MSYFLYLPVEIKVRELHSRLVLGAEALSRGWNVIVGTRLNEKHRLFEDLPPSIIVAKSGMATEMRKICAFQQRGHIYGVMDEEGFVTNANSRYSQIRYPESIRDQVDFSLLWGPCQTEALGTSDTDKKHFITGNPRLDLWRNCGYGLYDDQVRSLRAKYGKFLLVPSSFMACLTPDEIAERRIKRYIPDNYIETILTKRRENAPHMKFVVESYKKVLSKIGRSGYSIIFRPHPADLLPVVKDHFSDIPNLVISGVGPITPWVLASSAILHFNCTTAIEATLLGRPVAQYQPELDHNSFEILSNLGVQGIGSQFEDIQKLIAWVSAHLSSDTDNRISREFGEIEKYAFLPSDRSCSEVIMNKLETLGKPEGYIELSRPNITMIAKRSLRGLIARAKDEKIVAPKFPETSKSEVKFTVHKILERSNRPTDFQCRKICSNLFHLIPPKQ